MSEKREFLWWHWVARGSKIGSLWVKNFRQMPYLEITDLIDGSLRKLRNFELDQAKNMLSAAQSAINTIEDEDFLYVIQRFNKGVNSYYYYLIGDLSYSKKLLVQAHDAVCQALSSGRWHLMPLADQCLDFRHQRIRVARREHDWKEMARQISTISRIEDCKEPFCVLTDGTTLDISDLRNFYSSISLTKEEFESVRSTFDENLRKKNLRHLTQTLYVIPDMVIPYPY